LVRIVIRYAKKHKLGAHRRFQIQVCPVPYERSKGEAVSLLCRNMKRLRIQKNWHDMVGRGQREQKRAVYPQSAFTRNDVDILLAPEIFAQLVDRLGLI